MNQRGIRNMSTNRNVPATRPMQVGPEIDENGEVVGYFDDEEDYTPSVPSVADRRAPDGSKIVDKNYKRDLAQYRGMGSNIPSNASDSDVFDIIAGRMKKVAAYDGIPTKPLKDMVGKTIRISGAIISGKDSFSSKEFGEILEGYDVLKLKVTQIKVDGKWNDFKDIERNYVILHTGSTQPMKLFTAAFEAGFTAGDFPEGKSLEYSVSSDGNAIMIGPID